MKKIKFYSVLFLLGLQFACNKKKYADPVVYANDPVFNSTLLVNNVPVVLEAGKNGYYMFSSYKQDSNLVYNFIGTIKQSNCTNCPNSLQIQINDFKASALNAPVLIDSSLRSGRYNYITSQVPFSYVAKFQSSYNKNAASYLWNFGDGTAPDTSRNPVHVFNKAGNYNICLNVKGLNGCEASASNMQNIGSNNGFRTLINLNSVSSTSFSFGQSTTGNRGNLNYFWSFGDGSTSTLSNPTHVYSVKGSYPVSLRVTDTYNNSTIVSNYNVVTENDISSCAGNYRITSLISSNLSLSAIKISWIDANGSVYTTDKAIQSSSEYFELVSVEDYPNNENNQLTKKLHVKFKCNVSNGVTTLKLDNAEATICVAY